MRRVLLALLLWAAPVAALPARPAPPVPPAPLVWRSLRPGLELAERTREEGGARSWRLVLARIDPARFRFALASPSLERRGGWKWTVAAAPAGAAIAFNAGQFTSRLPWGWVVRDGRELLPPGKGPLSTAVVIDGEGRVQLVDADSLAAVRARGVADVAFQSYPALLVRDAEIPRQLEAPGRGVDLEHRDSRLALGILPDGRLLLALTRFAGFEGAVGAVPIGPTVRELAELMRELGCVRAVMLDGGISGQLLLRGQDATTYAWPGLRSVVMGLVGFPAAATASPRPAGTSAPRAARRPAGRSTRRAGTPSRSWPPGP